MDDLLEIDSLDSVTVAPALYHLYFDAFKAFDEINGNSVTVTSNSSGRQCDFDIDGICTFRDLDMLLTSSSVDTGTPTGQRGNDVFDLNDDGLIDERDLTKWLSIAATENGFAESFRRGDANLDGEVNSADLRAVGAAWQTAGNRWSTGDFDGNGTVDVHDLNQVGVNWRLSIPVIDSPVTLPEPNGNVICLLGMCVVGLRRELRRIRKF